MAASQTGPPAAAKAQPKWTLDRVNQMFASLDLPVCDDAKAIERKAKEKRDRYLADTKNADPLVRARAHEWFAGVQTLSKHRAELIQVVYDSFVLLADSAVSAALASGKAKLTPALNDNLRNVALRSCRADDSLAARFVRDYKKDRDLKDDGLLARPALVEDFSAESCAGRISLKWVLPVKNIDEVEVTREIELPPSGKKKSGKEELIHRGRGTSVADTGALPGARYIYRAYSWYQGIKSTESTPPVRAVCLAEASNAKAEYRDGQVDITWSLPCQGVSVIVLRKEGSPPGVSGADPSSKSVYQGPGTSCRDGNISEGAFYYYRIVCDFGASLLTPGSLLQASIPRVPPPAAHLTATYRQQGAQNEVALEWPPVRFGATVHYVVVRREGSTPPGNPGEGSKVADTPQTRCVDGQVESGRRYTYAVFTRAGDQYSRSGAAAPPVDILADVTELRAKSGDGTVELEWKTPKNVTGVIIRRSLNPPENLGDGAGVKSTGVGHAKDEALHNGKRYHYLVCCLYRPDGVAEVFSRGVRIAAVPSRPCDAVENFRARVEGRHIVCTWHSKDYGGNVVVLRSSQSHELPFGKCLDAEDFHALETRIRAVRVVTTQAGLAVDTSPEPNTPYYYSVFTVAGQHAVAGAIAPCIICPDITDLTLSPTRDGIILRWAWPGGCTAALVARRTDAWPQGADDPDAVSVHVSHTDYTNAGMRFVQRIGGPGGRFFYTVYAKASGTPGRFFSPGKEPSCRAEISWKPWMTIRYRLKPGQGEHKRKEMHLSWTLEDPSPGFAGFMLIASHSSVPSLPSDGIKLLEWRPEEYEIAGEHEAWVSLEPVQKKGWARFFCKAMVVEPSQRQTTLFIHPDVATLISAEGQIMDSARPRRPRMPFRVPRTVICPECFKKFSTGEMLFTSYTGGEPVKGKYTWLDRLLRRPPRPPDKEGRKLTVKLCPEKHNLPFTAGAQESMVIGVIGAKFSGKSHYIASVIQSVENQVGRAFQAALIPVTEKTRERYKNDFYDRLFGDKLELAKTISTPLPLIYDLTLGGKLWGEKRNRAVTLALYDTAGDNLYEQDQIHRTLQYLRVACGVIFLVDPLQSPSVREVVPDWVPKPDEDPKAEPNVMISRVLTVLENGKVVETNEPLSVPVAVVLTKCDVLCDAGLMDTTRLWSTDTRHTDYYDAELHDDMTGMMGEYVQRWTPGAYNTVRQRFSRHAFFGVSSTGCASDKKTRRYRYISPWRVEDPLLWLLSELGAIPVRDKAMIGGKKR